MAAPLLHRSGKPAPDVTRRPASRERVMRSGPLKQQRASVSDAARSAQHETGKGLKGVYDAAGGPARQQDVGACGGKRRCARDAPALAPSRGPSAGGVSRPAGSRLEMGVERGNDGRPDTSKLCVMNDLNVIGGDRLHRGSCAAAVCAVAPGLAPDGRRRAAVSATPGLARRARRRGTVVGKGGPARMRRVPFFAFSRVFRVMIFPANSRLLPGGLAANGS